MAKTDVWMPLYIGDYLADTTRLTTEQHGAYLLLIMDYWRNGPPPDNPAILQQITRMSEHAWGIAQASIKHFFVVENGLWKHARIDAEMTLARENRGRASEKARIAAETRWKNAPSNAPSMPQAILDECPSPSPSPSSLQPTTTSKAKDKNTCTKTEPEKPKKQENGYSPDFLIFWNLYPERPGASKAAAYKAWQARMKAGADSADILSGTKRYADYIARNQTEPQYIKQPATFLGPDLHYQAAWAEPAKQFPQLSKAGSATALAAQEFLKNQAEKRAREAEKNAG